MWRKNKIAPTKSDIDVNVPVELSQQSYDSVQPLPKSPTQADLSHPNIRSYLVSLIETKDTNEKKTHSEKILEYMKLADTGFVGDITRVMEVLLELGFSGRADAERIFARAMYNAVCKSTRPESDQEDFRESNVTVLFQTPQGRDLLRRIIWCSTRKGDANSEKLAHNALSETSREKYSKLALDEICRDTEGDVLPNDVFWLTCCVN